jgi:hypothetical protein
MSLVLMRLVAVVVVQDIRSMATPLLLVVLAVGALDRQAFQELTERRTLEAAGVAVMTLLRLTKVATAVAES